MAMSKKDFIALADAMRDLNPAVTLSGHGPKVEDGREMQYEDTLNAIADFCQSQNPRFDRERWLDYIAGKCGPNGGAR